MVERWEYVNFRPFDVLVVLGDIGSPRLRSFRVPAGGRRQFNAENVEQIQIYDHPKLGKPGKKIWAQEVQMLCHYRGEAQEEENDNVIASPSFTITRERTEVENGTC